MWRFLRRQFLYFLIGFVITFVTYLFVRFDADKVVIGVLVGVIGGIVVAILLFLLERRFPDRSQVPPT